MTGMTDIIRLDAATLAAKVAAEEYDEALERVGL